MNEQPNQTKEKHFTALQSIRKIRSFEQRYKHRLLRIGKSFEHAFETYLDLERIHRSLTRYIGLMRPNPSLRESRKINPVLDAYLGEVKAIHERCLFWLKLYLGIIWPQELFSRKMQKRIRTFSRDLWQTQARKSLKDLSLSDFVSPQRQTMFEKIRQLHENHGSLEPFSRGWNDNHTRLVNAVFDELAFTANELGQNVSEKFKKLLYSLSADTPGTHASEAIADWINGYKQPGKLELNAGRRANNNFLKGLALCEFAKNLKITVRLVVTGTCIVLLYSFLHSRHIDVGVYTFLKEKTLKLLSLDAASLNLKSKKDYFYKFILEINEQVKPEDIANELKLFREQRLYQQPSGMYLFTENILSKYLLLLSTGKSPLEIKSDILDTLGLMDNNVKSIIETITQMFDDKLIEDTKLRGQVLELRRALVRNNVFPFTFIVIKGNMPYLFMYPEKILERFRFTTQHLEHIGFNSQYYSQYVRFPLRVFVVKGDRYPFKDRAGYFEGEFAVVFQDLAARVEWSAWHEFAHIIDYMRMTYGGKMLPRNIEINAMLFPLLFSKDPQGYLQERLFPIVSMRDPKDAYVQATKGILNGFLLFDAQKKGTPKTEITDQFLPEDLLAAQKVVASLCNDSIRGIAQEIFRKPDIYLKTAKPGNYRGIISNAEEIIAGTPRAPYQGFILGSGYSFGGDDSTGIRFVFDNQGDDFGFFQGKNIFGIIHEIFLFMRQARNSGTKGFVLINFIASIVDFILILGFFLGLHWWGTPLRKRKYYGPDFTKWFDSVYRNNPLSDGRGSGDQPGEKQLLTQVIASNGIVPDDLAGKIRALKSGMNQQRVAVFDTLLTVAPFNPQMSLIRSKWHDLLFWLPFLGPTLGRNAWLFRRQKAFCQYEKFNERLLALAKTISSQTTSDIFRQRYLYILKDFKKPARASDPTFEKKLKYLEETRHLTEGLLSDQGRLGEQTTAVVARQLPWLSQHDGEFDHLASYSWNDDAKRIDWKATARSPNQEAKVRKYSGAISAKFDFLFDFRRLNHHSGRERLARDLARSILVLKNDNELKAVSLIMPWGETRQTILNLKSQPSIFAMLHKVWMAVTREFDDAFAQKQALKAEELVFYTDEENGRYRAITRLREFDVQEDIAQTPEHLPTRSTNIYIIGSDELGRQEILSLLPRSQQPFYWR